MRPSTFATSRALAAAGAVGCVVTALSLGACGQLLGVSSWVDVGPEASADGTVVDAVGAADGSSGGDALSDGTPAGETGPPGDGGANDASPCVSPVEGGAPGVLVPGVGGTPPYCIDATETTMGLYQRFLDDPSVNMANAPPECAWNGTYQLEYDPYDIPDSSDYPVTAINWCDAWGFCSYWGKRLCGNRTDGGPVDPSVASTTADEWDYACAGTSGNMFPYGNTYDAMDCRTGLMLNAGAGTVPTPTCVGGFPGLYDMSGNLEEWENSCIPSDSGDPRRDKCLLRGGTYFFPVASDTCQAVDDNVPRNAGDGGSSGVTIRCCWELP